jgi:hypothetical protein
MEAERQTGIPRSDINQGLRAKAGRSSGIFGDLFGCNAFAAGASPSVTSVQIVSHQSNGLSFGIYVGSEILCGAYALPHAYGVLVSD